MYTSNELNHSALHGHSETVKAVLATPKETQCSVSPALLEASAIGDSKEVNRLLANGADVRAEKSRVLLVALQNVHLDLARFLISKGADLKDAISSLSSDEQTAVVYSLLSYRYTTNNVNVLKSMQIL